MVSPPVSSAAARSRERCSRLARPIHRLDAASRLGRAVQVIADQRRAACGPGRGAEPARIEGRCVRRPVRGLPRSGWHLGHHPAPAGPVAPALRAGGWMIGSRWRVYGPEP